MAVQFARPDFDTVVTGLYEAAATTDLWPQALEGLARLTRSRGALVTRPDAAHIGLMHSPDLKDTVAQFFEQGWHRKDLRSERLLGTLDRGFYRDQDITSSEERTASDYYRSFARPAGVPWFAACGAIDADGSKLGISLQRSAGEGEFNVADIRRLARMEHHARAALSLSRRLVASQAVQRLEGLERLDVAALLLSRDGRVVNVNAQAERMLAGSVTVTARAGKVTSVAHSGRRQLERLVSHGCGMDRAGDATAPASVRLEGADGAAVLAQIVPVIGAAHDLFGDGGAILTFTPIVETTTSVRDGRLLAEAFGLTATEVRIAELLAQGRETIAIAQALGMGVGAVRFHLKSILPKAGVNRQAAFVALAASIRRPH